MDEDPGVDAEKVGKMDRKKEIIKMIQRLSGARSSYTIFYDWIEMMALSIQNTCSLWKDQLYQKRENEYLELAKRYSSQELMKMSEMMAMLTEQYEEGFDDILGDVFMKSGMGSSAAGQFFTPYHLSYLCAKTVFAGMQPDGKGVYTVNEPSSGGGGMIIALAEVMKENGINYQRRMDVVAQDLDWKGVYMTYVQLSLLGIPALCVQGDTIREPYDPCRTERSHILITPAKAGALV